ncbi:MAG: twin-arginine translocation signal domain-containing protein, partial [Lentisphaerae bacterium]|nr:twin-arginine translocation signal domain-containing protein [Lentisphaerota bacterium]
MATTTRREFLRRTLAAAAGAAAAPFILPGRARGAEGKAAPSARVTLGLIGMGKMCSGHLGGLLGRPDVQVVGLCDVEALRLESCRQRVAKAYAAAAGQGTSDGCSVT